MTTGKRIKKLRREKNITQIELGEIVGLTHSVISSIESDRSEATSKVITKLSDFFCVSTDYLLKGIERIGEVSEEEMEILNVLREDRTMRNAMIEVTKVKKKAINYLGGYTHNHAHAA